MMSYLFIFGRSKNLLIGPIPWIIAHGPKAKNIPNQLLDLNTSFERSLYKLSENHKMFEL